MSNNKIEYRIKSIDITEFNLVLREELKAKLYDDPYFNQYSYSVNCGAEASLKENIITVEITLRILLENGKEIEIGKIKILNNFILENFRKHYNEKKAKTLGLDPPFLKELFLVSISHTRAIMLTKCAGTFLYNTILPFIDVNKFIEN